MSHYDFGNLNNENVKNAQNLLEARKKMADSTVKAPKQAKIEINFNDQQNRPVDASSLDALGAYGQALALSNSGKKADLSGLGFSANDQAIVRGYVNPEQQAAISNDILSFFA